MAYPPPPIKVDRKEGTNSVGGGVNVLSHVSFTSSGLPYSSFGCYVVWTFIWRNLHILNEYQVYVFYVESDYLLAQYTLTPAVSMNCTEKVSWGVSVWDEDSWGARLKSRPGQRLSWHIFSWFPVAHPGKFLEIHHYRFFPSLSQFIIH
jgi:hypothetical protein